MIMTKCVSLMVTWMWLAAFSWFCLMWLSVSCSLSSTTTVPLTNRQAVSMVQATVAGQPSPTRPPTPLDVVQHVVQNLKSCGLHEPLAMRRVFLANRSVTCNDGSLAGYYLRKSFGSNRWIIFLEGGGYCFDVKSCANRWHRMKNLMSSKMWTETKNVGGILSPDPQENPHWWNANHVFVPYCSSDSWSGTAFTRTSSDSFSFLGSLIIDEVIKDLLLQGLLSARLLLLAGSSAGGTGVLLNLDRVADTLKAHGATIQVRGLADSGWFLDNEPYAPMECTDFHSCSPVESIKQGILLWNGQVPELCRRQQIPSETWKCYFGYKIYPTMKAPLFVFQWLFDEAQLSADNVGAPITKSQWNYIHEVGDHLRRTLRNVTAVFAPSCISHIVLVKRDWRFVKVNHVSLPEALNCWEQHQQHQLEQHVIRTSSETFMLSDAPGGVMRHRNLAAGVTGSSATMTTFAKLVNVMNISTGTSATTTTSKELRVKVPRNKRRKGKKRNRRRHKKGRKNRTRRSSPLNGNKPVVSEFTDEKTSAGGNKCHLHLLDDCTWPQCNRACPKLINPYTGEEMDFIELLKSFGLDMSSVATALGLDLDTLNAMGNDKLLQILQHSRK